jgi:hypothetical protein
MNQPDVVLFEKIYCWSQSNTWCVHISSLYTSSQTTGMSTCSNDCNICGKHFKRLESHFLKIWYVNHSTCLVVSMQQQQWHPMSRMTAAMWTPAMCCKGLLAVAWIYGVLLRMKVIKFYSFVMNPAPRLHNADNDLNWDGCDDKMQMIQEIMQIWRKLTKTFANVTMLSCSNLVLSKSI